MSTCRRLGASVLALAAALCAEHARADDLSVPEVIVTGQKSPLELENVPNTSAGITSGQAQLTTDVVTVEDELKQLPDVLIRERHIGDTQAPITTRTSGVGASARSLVYEDGVLVSALIGNNNTNASPRWDLISPDEVATTDILYGPFSAAFPGNSIGEVVLITTKTPDRLEGDLTLQGAWQDFSQYGTAKTFPTGRISGTLGDRVGKAWFWASLYHLDTEAQPLYDVTSTRPPAPSALGTPATGAYAGVSRTGAPLAVIGAGGLEHQTVDTATLKLGYDFTPTLTGVYTAAYYRNHDDAGVQSYLSAPGHGPIWSGSVNLGGFAYAIPASAFDNDLYRLQEDHLAQSLSLGSRSGGLFDWRLIASDYTYLDDRQRNPTGALPGAFGGGAGTITSLSGTNWRTLDADGDLRPGGAAAANRISFGLHVDQYQLESPKLATGDWVDGPAGAALSLAKGRTETQAAWAQDLITLAKPLTLTLGARLEHWRAYDGYNGSVSPALAVRQPDLSASAVSPKAVLAWTPAPAWRLTASLGRAVRFPTVEELYQSVTVGNQIYVPNPRLKPEEDVSEEIAAERTFKGEGGQGAGRLRLSLFGEEITNALFSQSAPLVPGSATLSSYVQNIGRTHARGVELVGQESGFLVPSLDLSGWATYVQSDIVADSGYAAAVGKQLPQLPRLRASALETWRASPRLAFTLSERYSDRSFGTIDNSDHVADTFTGFSAFFVVDLHMHWRLAPHTLVDLGVDNLNDRKYFLYHPFPQRTVVAQLKFTL